jgi:hypothetical protein
LGLRLLHTQRAKDDYSYWRAHVCRYCPEGSGIIWNPKDAIRTSEGDIKCLKCAEEDTNKMLVRVRGRRSGRR